MTNKVKPFYIRITEDMTPQMVQDAFDKCVDAGIKCDEWETSLELSDWEFFGFCGVSGMYLTDYSEDYEPNNLGRPQEITLGQLDDWLGLSDAVEWRNGDECNYMNSPVKHYFVGLNPILKSHCYILSDDGCVNYVEISRLSKPETPEQKAERERLEAIKEMAQTPKPCGFAIYDICEQLYDAGYRKQ